MPEQRGAADSSSVSRDDREQLLNRFEAAWQDESAPDIEEFLPSVHSESQRADDPTRQAVLHELVKIDLEYRWRRANARQGDQETGRQRDRKRSAPDLPGPLSPRLDCRRLEDYVERFPELGPLEDLPIDLLAEESRV